MAKLRLNKKAAFSLLDSLDGCIEHLAHDIEDGANARGMIDCVGAIRNLDALYELFAEANRPRPKGGETCKKPTKPKTKPRATTSTRSRSGNGRS